MARIAAIDIGTNSVLMTIAEGSADNPRVLADRATVTRLGEGVDQSGKLTPEAILRTLDVLKKYAEEAKAVGARIFAVSTSATRDAENSRVFLEPASAFLGSDVEIIDGKREAELTFRGSLSGIAFPGAVTVVDIGGGSTEIVRGEAGKVIESTSLNIGSVRLTERHLKSDPPTDQEMEALDRNLTAVIEGSSVQPTAPLVGIAGTVTTLAAVSRKMIDYDGAEVHGTRLMTEEVREMIAGFRAVRKSDRPARFPGLTSGRADVIIAGAQILLRLAERARTSQITVSDRGVRWGILVEKLSG
ncbi:MAG: Ppx/GppA family phosphatase [Deltaproteobacteria bacterium]|nr:Ppx/GppA family phosphatase [Deltaproteobacteria bacterium]